MKDLWDQEYLIGNLPSVMLNGKFGKRHLWLEIQWIVAMVIVAFLKEGMVCSLKEFN